LDWLSSLHKVDKIKTAPLGEGSGLFSLAAPGGKYLEHYFGQCLFEGGVAFPWAWLELFQSRFSRASLGEEFLLPNQAWHYNTEQL
jgi:hypothetical protein